MFYAMKTELLIVGKSFGVLVHCAEDGRSGKETEPDAQASVMGKEDINDGSRHAAPSGAVTLGRGVGPSF